MKIAPSIVRRIAVLDVPKLIVLPPDKRRQTELLLIVTLTVGVLAFTGGLSLLLTHGLTLGVILMLGIAAVLLCAYWLGRALHYLAGAALSSVTLNLAPFVYLGLHHWLPPAESFDTADILGTLAWLGPALILAAILLPVRWLMLLGGGASALALTVPTLLTAGDFSAGLAGLMLTGTLSALVIIARLQARRLERIRTAELTEARDQLEERVRERTEHLERLNVELQEARRAVEQAFRSRSEYLAEISHDMRAPLTVILGYSEMLAYHAAAQSDPDLVRRLRSLESAARYLTAISQSIVNLSALERGEMEFNLQPVSLPALYEEVCLLAQPLAARNRNAFESRLAEGVETIHTDPLRLRQALVNLLDNAAKFTQDGTIRFEVTPHIEPDGSPWIAFRVADTGIGIAPAQIKALFQPFPPSFRATRDRYSGSGLGLTITRMLTEHIGSRVEVESRLGQGSVFTLLAPAIQANRPTAVRG